MIDTLKRIRWLGFILVLGLAACRGNDTPLSTLTPTVTITPSIQPRQLATPYSQEPAAGICASFDGKIVTVTLNPDIPDPRCAKVRADQTLTIINRTQNTLQVSIGSFSYSLEPGASKVIDTPFGDYLAPGVHQLQVSPCCGSELWLEEK